MARDVEFLNLILNHTLKVADKSDGQSKKYMLEQADRIRVEIAEARAVETLAVMEQADHLGFGLDEQPIKKRVVKKKAKKRKK